MEQTKMLEAQGNKCAICGRVPGKNKRLGVDHDHNIGEIRGLLCAQCNHAIGLLQDSEGLCLSAASYLHR